MSSERTNQGPPPNVAPSELWRRLNELPRPSKEVDYPRMMPGTDTPVGQLVMWPLSQNELMAVNAEADKFAKRLIKDAQKRDEANLGYDSIYSNEVAVQVLFRACRDASDPKRSVFPSPTELRDMSSEEVGALFAIYAQVQVELGPIVTRMGDDEMEAWVSALAEGGAHVPFPLLSSETQFRLLTFMASRVVRSRTANTSVGSPPEDSSEPSPEEP